MIGIYEVDFLLYKAGLLKTVFGLHKFLMSVCIICARIRNSAANNKTKLPITNTDWIKCDPTETNDKPTASGKHVRFYLQIMHLCTERKESQLVDYIRSNGTRGMFKFYDRLSPGFGLVDCLLKPLRGWTELYETNT